MIDKLEIFLKEAVGNKYGINTQKLLFNRSTIKIEVSTSKNCMWC